MLPFRAPFFKPSSLIPVPPRTTRNRPAANGAEPAELDQSTLLDLVGYNCRQTYLSIMPFYNQRMAKYALRPAEYTVITLVNRNPNVNQKQLSQAINVSPPNLATLLDRLEERGLVVRQRNPADKRSQTLVLTAEGQALCKKADKTAYDLEIEATAMLSDAERAELMRLLQKVFLPR